MSNPNSNKTVQKTSSSSKASDGILFSQNAYTNGKDCHPDLNVFICPCMCVCGTTHDLIFWIGLQFDLEN